MLINKLRAGMSFFSPTISWLFKAVYLETGVIWSVYVEEILHWQVTFAKWTKSLKEQ